LVDGLQRDTPTAGTAIMKREMAIPNDKPAKPHDHLRGTRCDLGMHLRVAQLTAVFG